MVARQPVSFWPGDVRQVERRGRGDCRSAAERCRADQPRTVTATVSRMSSLIRAGMSAQRPLRASTLSLWPAAMLASHAGQTIPGRRVCSCKTRFAASQTASAQAAYSGSSVGIAKTAVVTPKSARVRPLFLASPASMWGNAYSSI